MGNSAKGERRRRPLRWAVLVLLVAGAGWVALNAVAVLRASGLDQRDPVGAVVVLGAAQYNGRPSPVLQARLDHALELYEQGVAPRIVLTGYKQPGDQFTEAFAGYRYLTKKGVPGEDLTIVDDGTSTWESLKATERVLRKQGVESVVLVSDPYHSRRLIDIADEVGLRATVSPTTAVSAWQKVARETALVSAGRVVTYRRLLRAKGG